MDRIIELGKATPTVNTDKHISSKMQADTLFTFTTELNYIIAPIKNKLLSPRYCVENIEYLNIPELSEIAFPMKCFCDINLHKLGEHLEWYGYYGIAFSKKWGMDKGLQPIQYINPYSKLCEDFSSAFSKALNADSTNETDVQSAIKSYMIHEMMYYKPYSGNMQNRVTNKKEPKCFTDECEWRYVPNVTIAGFEHAYINESILNPVVLNNLSNSMATINEIALSFEYQDIKYIIVKSDSDFKSLVNVS